MTQQSKCCLQLHKWIPSPPLDQLQIAVHKHNHQLFLSCLAYVEEAINLWSIWCSKDNERKGSRPKLLYLGNIWTSYTSSTGSGPSQMKMHFPFLMVNQIVFPPRDGIAFSLLNKMCFDVAIYKHKNYIRLRQRKRAKSILILNHAEFRWNMGSGRDVWAVF